MMDDDDERMDEPLDDEEDLELVAKDLFNEYGDKDLEIQDNGEDNCVKSGEASGENESDESDEKCDVADEEDNESEGSDESDNSDANKADTSETDKADNIDADKADTSDADKADNFDADKAVNSEADKADNVDADKAVNSEAVEVGNSDADKTITSEAVDADDSPPILKFLEAVVHQAVYIRNIYPKSIFVKHALLGVPVQLSIHPSVNDYITKSIINLMDLVEEDHKIKSFAVVIASDKTREKLFIEMDISKYAGDEFYDDALEPVLISVIQRLNIVMRRFKHARKPTDWWIEIITGEEVPFRLCSDSLWTEIPLEERTCDTGNVGCEECLIVPVLTLNQPFKVHAYIQAKGLVKRKSKSKKKYK